MAKGLYKQTKGTEEQHKNRTTQRLTLEIEKLMWKIYYCSVGKAGLFNT